MYWVTLKFSSQCRTLRCLCRAPKNAAETRGYRKRVTTIVETGSRHVFRSDEDISRPLAVLCWQESGTSAARWVGSTPLNRAKSVVRCQNMALSSTQKHITLHSPIVPLHFLVHLDTRIGARQHMAGFSDSAIFHRWMSLCWTFTEAEAVALLTPEEQTHLRDFNAVFESLPWNPIESHPHISELANNDLSALLPPAKRLLESLERRTRPSVLKRWWRRAVSFCAIEIGPKPLNRVQHAGRRCK